MDIYFRLIQKYRYLVVVHGTPFESLLSASYSGFMNIICTSNECHASVNVVINMINMQYNFYIFYT